MTWWQILLTILAAPFVLVIGICLAALLHDRLHGRPRTLYGP